MKSKEPRRAGITSSLGWFAVYSSLLVGLLMLHFAFADTAANDLPECGPGEGFICPATSGLGLMIYDPNPTCRDPAWTWDKQKKAWEHFDSGDCSKASKGAECTYMKHEDVAWRNAFSKKWPPGNSKYPSGFPYYDENRDKMPYKKYNPPLKNMTECNPDQIGPYDFIATSVYRPPCEKIPPEDEAEWTIYYQGQEAKHQAAWDICRKEMDKRDAEASAPAVQNVKAAADEDMGSSIAGYRNMILESGKSCKSAETYLARIESFVQKSAEKKVYAKRAARLMGRIPAQLEKCGIGMISR